MKVAENVPFVLNNYLNTYDQRCNFVVRSFLIKKLNKAHIQVIRFSWPILYTFFFRFSQRSVSFVSIFFILLPLFFYFHSNTASFSFVLFLLSSVYLCFYEFRLVLVRFSWQAVSPRFRSALVNVPRSLQETVQSRLFAQCFSRAIA